jgi:RsiW-degrading membrane proteinase PrsW (M82 family)
MPLTPVEGFTAGLLSGAGYALFESLALASGGEQWAALVFARIGTAGIHILTTGLTGWALVLAWRRRRFLRLAATYVFVVSVHGVWNASRW